MKERILWLIIFVFFYCINANAVTVAQQPADWVSGTGGTITNLAELRWLSETNSVWDEDWGLGANIDASETKTWNSGEGFSPIGNSTTKFTGTFNGQGYHISNLYIKRPSNNHIGLFGYTSNAAISNVGMENNYCEGQNLVGSLIGYNYSTNISNCYSTGSVIGNNTIGGLIGFNYEDTISNCYATGYVQGAGTVGGFIGEGDFNSKTINCYSTGAVSGGTSGGFMGVVYFAGSINKCYYDTETSNQSSGIGFGSSSELTGLTTEEFKTDSLAGFKYGADENNPWVADTSGRPYLYFQDVKISNWLVSNDSVAGHTTAAAGINIVETGLCYRIDTAEAWTYASNGPGDSEGFLKEPLPSLEIALYIMQAYAIDQNGNYYYGDAFFYNKTEIPGSGTETDPWRISTLAHLQYISENPSTWTKYFIQTANINAAETKSWNSGEGFSPIGNSSTDFTGNYNGQGYTIDSIYVNSPSAAYVGFFGSINGATIANIALENSNIEGNIYVGSLVGHSYNSDIINCYNTGFVNGNQNVGGLIGLQSSTTISNCFNSGVVYGYDHVGGIVGYQVSSTLTNCYNTGLVKGSSDVGGLIGVLSSGSINSCYSTGYVNGNSNVGGIIGDNNSTVSYCYYDIETAKLYKRFGNQSGLNTVDYTAEDFKVDSMPGFTYGSSDEQPWVANSNGRPYFYYQPAAISNGIVQNDTLEAFVLEFDETKINETGIRFRYDTASIWVYQSEGPGDVAGTFSESLHSLEYGAYIIQPYAVDTSGSYYFGDAAYYVNTPLKGEGRRTNPWLINNFEDLIYASEDSLVWTGHYIQTADIDATGSDTLNAGKGLIPIGNSTNIFTGSYDGQGYTIHNLTINRPSQDYVGLFGYTYLDTISNIKIENCSVTGNNYTAGLIGYSGQTTIYNVGIVNSSMEGNDFTGGLAGYVTGSEVSDIVLDNNSITGALAVGGLLGYSYTSTNISDCFSNGIVEGDERTGGLVGSHVNSAIEECYVTGTVNGVLNTGGLTGLNHGASVFNCYSLVNITGNENTGGFTGYNSSSSTISYSYSAGVVAGNTSTGAFIGNNSSSSVVKCYIDTETSGLSNSIGSDDNSQAAPEYISSLFSNIDNFIDWDFDEIWYIGFECQLDSVIRPFFQWQMVNVSFFVQGDGALSGNAKQKVGIGCDAQEVEAIPNTGYYFVEWQAGNGETLTTENPLTVTEVENDTSLTAIFSNIYYFTSEIATGKGSINISSVSAAYNSSVMYTITPDAGYVIDSIFYQNNKVTSGLIQSEESYYYNVTVAEDGHLKVYFSFKNYAIRFSAGTHGSIFGDTLQYIMAGDDAISVAAIADDGYQFHEWQSSAGESITSENPLIVTNVTKDSSLTAIFRDTYYFTSEVSSGEGTIEISNLMASYNSSVTYTITPNAGYVVDSVIYQEENITSGLIQSEESHLYIVTVREDGHLKAYFSHRNYAVKFSAGLNGSIFGDTLQYISTGEDALSVVAIADNGYLFSEWQDNDGNYVSIDNPITIYNVLQDTFLVAVFKEDITSGIESNKDSKIVLYAYKNNIYVKLGKLHSDAIITVYNISGNVVAKTTIYNKEEVLKLNVVPGFYFVNVYDGKVYKTEKVFLSE